jgi:hypothetical protein
VNSVIPDSVKSCWLAVIFSHAWTQRSPGQSCTSLPCTLATDWSLDRDLPRPVAANEDADGAAGTSVTVTRLMLLRRGESGAAAEKGEGPEPDTLVRTGLIPPRFIDGPEDCSRGLEGCRGLLLVGGRGPTPLIPSSLASSTIERMPPLRVPRAGLLVLLWPPLGLPCWLSCGCCIRKPPGLPGVRG